MPSVVVFGRMFAMPPRDTTYFTPNAKFYVVNYADGAVSVSRDLNIEQWKLHVKGAVKTPMSLGWRDILNRDSYDQISTLMCIDTLPGGDSMGNATWRGISLKKLLHDAAPMTETARDVVFRGIDGYDDSIPFTRAMQDDVMLAFLMNGEKLPKEHGFPLRLLVPGLYGIKNVKWIVEIEVYPGRLQRLLAAQRMDRRRHHQDFFAHRLARTLPNACADRNTYSAASPSADRTASAK